MEATEDESFDGAPVSPRHRRRGPDACLAVLFESGAPSSVPPIDLRGLDAVSFVRSEGVSTSCRPSEVGGERRLSVEIPDRRMSLTHAQARRTSEGWFVEDANSRNGTRLNGNRIERALLRSGDLIELGRSIVVYQDEAVGEVGPETGDGTPQGLRTSDPGLALQFLQLRRLAPTNIPILVRGETGTGKELVARAVHQLSGRTGALRSVNCGALPRTLIESELFGYKKGAFSGASEDRPGLVRSADRGTLFLDEIGDLAIDAQVALLRALQEGEVVPLGAVAPVRVDVRVVAATHRDLSAMVARGRFREDLLARLSGFTLTLPPLRARRVDIGRLIHHLVQRHGGEGAAQVAFTPAAMRALCAYHWPTNVRELEQVLRSALALAEGRLVDLPHLGPTFQAQSRAPVAEQGHREMSRDTLDEMLTRHQGNVTAAAAELHTSRMQVHRLCKRFGIDIREYRPRP